MNVLARIKRYFKFKIHTFQRKTRQEKWVYCCYFVFFSIVAIIISYPVVWTFINSFKGTREFRQSSFDLPELWLFDNYSRVFTEFRIADVGYFTMLFNSLWILVVKVFVNVASSLLLAYPIAKFRFPGRNFLYGLVLFIQTIPIVGSGPAAYKLMYNLNMVNNPTTIWMAWAGGFDFAFVVFYGAFLGVSKTYSEAAKIDGASEFVILGKIVFPQIVPAVTAIAITQMITVWNDYGVVQVYLRDYPNLAYGLFMLKKELIGVKDLQSLYFTAIVISIIPPVILYSASQKLMLENISIGGIKG